MDNARYADLLNEIAALLEVSGANPFKVRAFQRAARTVDGLPDALDARIADGTVTDIDGIGKSIAADLKELRERGSCGVLDDLRASLPPGITQLLDIQGLGPKKVQKIYDTLGIGDIDTLEAYARDGRLADLPGFGKRTEEKILSEIQRLRSYAGRTPYAKAWPIAADIVACLRELPQVERAEIAGSLRRGRETVGDLDFVVASSEPEPVMAWFAGRQDVDEVIARGDTKTSVYLRGGLSADLRVVPPEVFGATLHHFTGSKDHNVEMRGRALKRGLRVSEWGVFRRNDDGDEASEELVACATEHDIFAAVGLPFIPPELRSGTGEIAAAEAGTLPVLIEVADVRGDLHMHTTWSDGRYSVAEMAEAAAARGLGYICITDHSRALTVANGLDRDRLLRQIDEIAEYNAGTPAVRVLCGLEADILEDGEIDMDVDVLERLDWVVGSVHSRMNQPADVMTERLLRAVDSGLISAIGHPTGRLIGQRDPFGFDFDAVLEACARRGVALEINASPERLDLNDAHIRRVLERDDVWLTINTDAHSTAGLEQIEHGVKMARRGGTPASRVLNTLEVGAFLDARRAPAAI